MGTVKRMLPNKRRCFFGGSLLAFLLFFGMLFTALPVSAEETLISRVDVKAAPTILFSGYGGADEENLTHIGADDTVVVNIAEGDLSAYSYADRLSAPEMMQDSLRNAYSVLGNVYSLGELDPRLDAEVQKIDTSYSSAAFVVNDLLAFSLADAVAEELLLSNPAYYLQVTMAYVVPEGGAAPVAIRQNVIDRTWSLVDETDLIYDREKGCLTLRMEEPSVIALLTVDPSRMDSAVRGASARYIWLGVVAILVAIAAAVSCLLIFSPRRSAMPEADPSASDENGRHQCHKQA